MSYHLLKDLPVSIIEQICRALMHYGTVLVRNGDIAGSATYVKCGSMHGILTAHHVAFQSSPPFDFTPGSTDRLGFSVADFAHAFEIEMQHLVPHEIGIPVSDDFGPDLLFLEIPESESRLGTILARRQFWNVSITPDERIAECYKEADLNCVWANVGSPHEMQTSDAPSLGFDQVKLFPSLVGITGIDAIHQKGDFDYFDSSVSYHNRIDLPKSFAGYSGGGLWRIPLYKEETPDSLGAIRIGKPVLAGVQYYQGPVENSSRIVRAHGPKSIYEVFRRKMNG